MISRKKGMLPLQHVLGDSRLFAVLLKHCAQAIFLLKSAAGVRSRLRSRSPGSRDGTSCSVLNRNCMKTICRIKPWKPAEEQDICYSSFLG